MDNQVKVCPKGHTNIPTALYCRICGAPMSKEEAKLPFYLRCPEYHLRPFSEFDNLFFMFNTPDYVEDPSKTELPDYLWIVKDEKFGILYWHVKEKWWGGKEDDYRRIIQCKYKQIEKRKDMFICTSIDGHVDYLDLKGNILK
jgi:hypothetical protein